MERGKILNIPNYSHGMRQSVEQEESDNDVESQIDEGDEGIGEFDDGKTGKLTLAILITEELIEPGEGVMSIDYLGQTFKGDLMPIGKIKSTETGLIFNNPSAWAIYCKKIVNPAKKSGCGWASVKYKGRKMDYYKNIWLKRKAHRDTEGQKSSTSITPVKQYPHPTPEKHIKSPTTVKTSPHPKTSSKNIVKYKDSLKNPTKDKLNTYIDLETFAAEGKIQPFTVSVSTSAMLILDLHSHMSHEPVCGYLAGQWDLNAHNLAITNTFPCLINNADQGSAKAQQVETNIYEELYAKHLTLVGWYHSNPQGPAAPSAKDCCDQLDFQVKILGTSDATYTPCVGLICVPYDPTAPNSESSIIVYWVYPPAENLSQEYGKPMRMSYSAITDPCLSEHVIGQIDNIIRFYKEQPDFIQFQKKYDQNQRYATKLGKSLISKFPRDQDERLWKYIRSQVLEKEFENIDDPLTEQPGANGCKNIEEEEIDDDEETALQEEQEEIDDDEENALSQPVNQKLKSPTFEKSYVTSNQLPSKPLEALANSFHMNSSTSLLKIAKEPDAPFNLTNKSSDAPFNLTNKSSDSPFNLTNKSSDAPFDLTKKSSDTPFNLTKKSTDAPFDLTNKNIPASPPSDAPLNFSRSHPEDDDSDDGRLVIKE